VFRFSLLFLQGVVLVTAIAGIYLTFSIGGVVFLLLLILIYFTGHVSFDPVPRYAIPAMPYLFIFTATGLMKIIEIIKGRSK
jgi:hypothetical protein